MGAHSYSSCSKINLSCAAIGPGWACTIESTVAPADLAVDIHRGVTRWLKGWPGGVNLNEVFYLIE